MFDALVDLRNVVNKKKTSDNENPDKVTNAVEKI